MRHPLLLPERIAAGLGLAIMFFCAVALALDSYTRHHSRNQAHHTKQPRTNDPEPDPTKSVAAQQRDKDAEGRAESQPHASDKEGQPWRDWFVSLFESHEKFWVAFGTMVIAAFTAVLSIATVLLAISTNKLGRAGERQIEIAKETADAVAVADRPHLVPTTLSITGIRQPPDATGNVAIQFSYRFENSGKSPAFVQRYCVMREIARELPALPAYGKVTETKRIVAPDGWYGSATPSRIAIPAQTATRVLNGDEQLFIFGFIEYENVAKRAFKIRFAFSFEFGTGDASERYYPTGPDSYWEYT